MQARAAAKFARRLFEACGYSHKIWRVDNGSYKGTDEPTLIMEFSSAKHDSALLTSIVEVLCAAMTQESIAFKSKQLTETKPVVVEKKLVYNTSTPTTTERQEFSDDYFLDYFNF